jgi:TolA-binding protein
VDTYRKAITEAANPDRVEEAMQRIVTALHLAGQYKASDEACVKFEQTYPASTLLPLVWFRAAENARLSAMAATADQNMRGKKAELDKMFEEAVTRYQRVLKKFPEFPYVNLARYGLGLSYYHQEKYAESLAALTEIAGADRIGDLAGVPYMLADCLLRLLPAETDDGLKGAQLLERAEQAGKLLEGFAMSLDAKSTLAPDAWLKLGYCYQRMGMALADPAEKTKVFTAARQAYEKISQQYNNSPAMPYSVFERAKCMALQGDANGAINELNRFQGDPLKNSPVAPLALVRLAGLLRSQNRMADALKAMEQCRQLEGGLKDDPLRSQWIPLIQYEHALAVKESGKPVEARAMFDALAKQFPTRLEGVNALWRSGQCRRDELQAAIATAKATIVKPGVQRPQIEAAIKAVTDGLAAMAQTAEFFKTEAAKLAQSVPDSEARLRMLYELAWCQRTLAEAEIIAAREKLQRAALDKVLENFRKRNQPAPALNAPDVPLSAVLPQPSEKAARDAYAAVIASKSEAAVVARARLELAEMMQERGEITGALEVLAPALDLSPPLELAERIRLRTASCLIAKKDAKTALAQLQPVLQNAKSTLAAEARYLAGDAHIAAKDWPNAVTQLLPFRDQDPWRNVPEVADKALMRLGYALAQANRWDESRQAYENLVQRFQQSPWFFEARYGIGWAHKNANRHEEAVNAFNEVTRGTAAEVAARAQLHAGLCRLAQKRFPEAATALLVVPTTYDCPEHSAPALCEAGQAQLEQKKVAEAVKLWESVIKDYPTSNWAEVAKQRLAGVKKP